MRNKIGNSLYKGDCKNIINDKLIIPSGSVNLIFTSPPYAGKRRKYYGGSNAKEYIDWFIPISDGFYRILKNDGSLILNMKEGAQGGERQTYVIEMRNLLY